jgi:hypothetical protein
LIREEVAKSSSRLRLAALRNSTLKVHEYIRFVSSRVFAAEAAEPANSCQVSGGGGWGAKKGLLSLDPQRTHFAPSEEESFIRFMGAMEASEFAPVGSHIQFFTPLRASTHHTEERTRENAVILGVHDANVPAHECAAAKIHHGMFGALSNVSVFTSDGSLEESKLSVPNSRICLHGGFDDKDPWPADLATDSALLMMHEIFREVAR